MQTPTLSALSAIALPVTAENPAVGAAFDLGRGGEAPFAAMLRGFDGPVTIESAGDFALPAPALDAGRMIAALPVLAGTGKILPAPGKEAADLPPNEHNDLAPEPMAAEPSLMSPALISAVSLVLQADPAAASPAAKPSEPAPAGASGAPTPIAMFAPVLPAAANISAQPSAYTNSLESPAPQTVARIAPAAHSAAPTITIQPAAAGPAADTPHPAGLVAVTVNAASPVATAPIASEGVEQVASASTGPAPALAAAATPSAQPVPAPSAAPVLLTRKDIGTEVRAETPHRQGQDDGAGRRTGSETAASPSVRLPVFDATALAAAMPVPAADRMVGAAPTASPLAPTAAPLASIDRADAIASVVDRIAAAREVGMGSLSSLAVAHRDFGEITVSFLDKGNALDVSLTAAGEENQRALAAALQTAERPVARDAAAPAPAAPSPSSSPSQSAHHNGAGNPSQDRSMDGQSARDSGGRQARDNGAGDTRRPASNTVSDMPAAEADRRGLYV